MRAVDARARLEAVIAKKGSVAQAAKDLGVTKQYVYDLKRGFRPFSVKMLEKLGLRREVVDAR